ncbi:hypothetical protein BDR26DRAFT_897629 [Obelidium mucronatum]|nr:hypothetical protein BDR26DRAFT_897629 [Obelidium mucronatum]
MAMLQPFNLAALGKTRDLSKVNTNEGLTLDQFQELLLEPETAFFYKKSLVFKDNKQKKSYANDPDFQVWANGFAPTQREVATLQKLVQEQGMLIVLVASEHKRVKNTLDAPTHFQVLVFHHGTAHQSVVFYQPLKDFDIWPTQTHLLVTHLRKSFFDNIHIVNGDQHGESDCALRCLDFIRQYIALPDRGGMPRCLTERVMRVPYNGDLVKGSKSERFLKGALKGGMGETGKGETGKSQKDMAVGASFSDSDGDDLRLGENSKEESVVDGGQCDDFVILISEQDVETSQEKGKSLKREVEYREESLEKDEEYWQERAEEQDEEWRPERAKSAKHQVKDADTSSEAYSPEDDCGESLSSSLSDASDSSEGETDDIDSSSASSSDDNGSLDSDMDSEAGVDSKRLRLL